jgi:hypothetical protein
MNNKSDTKPHVEVFGNTVDDDCKDDGHGRDRWHHWHDHHHDAPVLGVMFLLAGIMLFLNVIGQVPWTVWHVIWQFWPVILIFIGIQILSGLILFLLALFVFGIIAIYSLQAVGAPIAAHWILPEWITFWLVSIRRVMP